MCLAKLLSGAYGLARCPAPDSELLSGWTHGGRCHWHKIRIVSMPKDCYYHRQWFCIARQWPSAVIQSITMSVWFGLSIHGVKAWSRASSWSSHRKLAGGSTNTPFKPSGGPTYPTHELHPSFKGLFSLWECSSCSSLRPSQSTPYTSNSFSSNSSSAGNWSPQMPWTNISKPNKSAGDWLGAFHIWILCWFQDSAKNASCWLRMGKKRWCKSEMWWTVRIRPRDYGVLGAWSSLWQACRYLLTSNGKSFSCVNTWESMNTSDGQMDMKTSKFD
jgi:hypothetical protein